jgi:type I restriction enzyme M protein
MIDAKDLYAKDGSKNRLREQDIKLIVDTWESKEEKEHFSRFVKWDEIEKNDFNLNIPRYVAQIDTTIQQDIERHLHGNLPVFDIDEQMAHIWQSCTTLKDKLYKRVGDHYELLTNDFLSTIDSDRSFIEQREKYSKLINQWVSVARPTMMEYDKGGNPKLFIENLAGSLLNMAIKSDLRLIEPYNVYQLLMSQCAEFMQDDAYIVKHDGWIIPMPSAPLAFDKESKTYVPKSYDKTEYSNLQHDLLPIRYVVAEYFAKEQQEIDETNERIAQKETEIEEVEEAHSD